MRHIQSGRCIQANMANMFYHSPSISTALTLKVFKANMTYMFVTPSIAVNF